MAALATFVKWKIKVPGVSVELTAGQEDQFDEPRDAAGADILGYYCQNIFEMKNFAGAYTSRERGIFGVHYINTTGGELDTTWTSADYAAAEAATQAMISGNPSFFSNGMKLVEHRWYPFGPGATPPNPPSRVTSSLSISGSASTSYVRQVASNVTLRTTLRKHWGRIYLPVSTAIVFDTNGQASTGNVDQLATLARTWLLAAETSQGVMPCVYDRARKQAFGVTSIEVDSVPDVQRRRRPRDSGYRKVLSV